MRRAAFAASARAVVIATVALAVVLGVLALVSALEPGTAPTWRALAVLFGPAALAGAAAATLSIEQREGRWAGWQAMGRDPRTLLTPLLAAVLLGGGLQLTGTAPIAPLPAPVDPETPAWWDVESRRWAEVPGGTWRAPPHALDLEELVERARTPPPTGARQSVDRGELVRRVGLALGWLVAFLSGVRIAPVARRSHPSLLVAGAKAAGCVLAWQVLVIFSAAWAAAP